LPRRGEELWRLADTFGVFLAQPEKAIALPPALDVLRAESAFPTFARVA
jgi:hypothetical protein